MKKIILIFLAVGIFAGFSALAQTTSTSDSIVTQLMAQIQALQTQIQALIAQTATVRTTQSEIKQTLSLIRQLRQGMTGEDVKLLQELLATDPDIYPEGKVTGFFGSLTKKAVARFQQKAGLDQVGQVGPKTLSKINELLAEGAGNSGKVPPGLLIAPGIRAKLGYQPQPLPGQVLPPGIAKKLGQTATGDTTPPTLSLISAINTATSSTMITWTTNELSDSKVFYDTISPLLITDSTSNAVSIDFVLSHSVSLFGLLASTDYYYIVSSTDMAGNTRKSGEQSFHTVAQ